MGTPVGQCLPCRSYMPWSSSLYDWNFHRSFLRSIPSIGMLDSNISFGRQLFIDTTFPFCRHTDFSIILQVFKKKLCVYFFLLFYEFLWIDLVHCIYVGEVDKVSSMPFGFQNFTVCPCAIFLNALMFLKFYWVYPLGFDIIYMPLCFSFSLFFFFSFNLLFLWLFYDLV